MRQFSQDEPEFGDLMRRLVPEVVVIPHRLCDGGRVVLRARLVLDLGAVLGEGGVAVTLAAALRREVVIDLFVPPQRAKHREAILDMCRRGLNVADAARKVRITKTAGQYALRLDRRMRELGLTDPYVQLTEPPGEGNRLKRHLRE